MSDADRMIHDIFDKSHGHNNVSAAIEAADRYIEENDIFGQKKADADRKEIRQRLAALDMALDELLS